LAGTTAIVLEQSINRNEKSPERYNLSGLFDGIANLD